MLLRPWLSVAHSCHLVRGEAGSVFVLGAERHFFSDPQQYVAAALNSLHVDVGRETSFISSDRRTEHKQRWRTYIEVQF